MKHNHITRDLKDAGECPACDEYWVRQLRAEIDDCARKLHKAYVARKDADYHFELGCMYGMVARLYELNAKVHTEALTWP